MRMGQERLPQKLFKWTSPGEKKRESVRRSWNEGIRQAIKDHLRKMLWTD